VTPGDLASALAAAGAPPEAIKIALDAFTAALDCRKAKLSRQEQNRRAYLRLKALKATTENAESALNSAENDAENMLKNAENSLACTPACAPAFTVGEVRSNIPQETTSLTPKIKTARRKARRPIASDEQPTDQDCAVAAHLPRETFRREWQKFRDHHIAKGSLMADWRASWRTWVANIEQFARAGPPSTRNGKPSIQDVARRLCDEFSNNPDGDMFSREGDQVRDGSVRLLS
jgi:hypothetical protein